MTEREPIPWYRRIMTDAEVALGGVQMRAIERAMVLATGLDTRKTPDGVAYYARANKAGLPLVCVHGFGGDKETWLMMSALIRRSRGLALVDLPGHGRSDELTADGGTIRAHAEAVLRVMDEAGFERAVLCGNSMGGGVSLRLAASWPDRVAGLVLVSSIGRKIHDGSAHQWIHGDNPLIPTEDDIEPFMKLVLERPLMVPRSVIRYVVTQRVRRADALKHIFKTFVEAGGEAGVPGELSGLAMPALVIHGEQDRIIDKRVAEDYVAALPRSELVVMRGVGHAPQLEAPRPTAKLVEKFVRRVEDDARAQAGARR